MSALKMQQFTRAVVAAVKDAQREREAEVEHAYRERAEIARKGAEQEADDGGY